MRPTFEQTVDVLVKAYLNDTLKHDDCAACVVGNLCGGNTIWKFLFMTDPRTRKQQAYLDSTDHVIAQLVLAHYGAFSVDHIKSMAIDVVGKTGYSIPELAMIENTFEMADPGSNDEEWMFNGLMAVVDVLAEIHNVDLTVKENAKLLFVK